MMTFEKWWGIISQNLPPGDLKSGMEATANLA
jgi:hypothetical protein